MLSCKLWWGGKVQATLLAKLAQSTHAICFQAGFELVLLTRRPRGDRWTEWQKAAEWLTRNPN
eukprot:4679128-Pleurochrysis_carterae.AAC.1